MMGYFGNGEYYGGMMGGGAGIFMFFVMIVVLVDLVLLGMWLWKQLKK